MWIESVESMKDIIFNFVAKVGKLFVAFFITLFTVILASNNRNIIYTFLENHGFKDEVMKKAVLSALIVLLLGLIQVIIWLLNKLFIWWLSKYFKKLLIELEFRVDGRVSKMAKFEPKGKKYTEKKVNVKLMITPAGKFSMYILKHLDIGIDIFFNPQILDITLENDSAWLGENPSSVDVKLDEKQSLGVLLLRDYKLGGIKTEPFERTVPFFIMPRRLAYATTSVNFKINSYWMNKISRKMCSVSWKNELNVSCKGEE